MPDREKVIKHFEHLLNAAKGNYQDFVDLTVDVGEDILVLLKECQKTRLEIAYEMVSGSILMYQGKELVRCKDCKYAHKTYDCDCKYCDMFTDDEGNPIERYRSGDWFCADGERKNQ